MLNKIVFFGGKGGVGKTTCSAAFACYCSRNNLKTLVVSTDPAHSLSDIFSKKIGSSVTYLKENLSGLEIDSEEESKRYINTIKANMKDIVSPVIISEISRQLDAAAVSPGSEEAAVFDKIVEILIEYRDKFDQIIFDTAPTGHTLRLLSLPELLGAWLDNLLSKRKQALKLMKMASIHDKNAQEELQKDPIIRTLQQRKEKFEKAREIMINKEKVSFIFVLNAERLPIEETKKAIKILQKYTIPVGGVVVNRILPANMQDEFWKKRKDLENTYLEEIASTFKDQYITYLPLLNSDIQAHVLENIADNFKNFKS
ncbi:MAG: ArsA family ATPase [Peptococcaceae bacterium]